MRKGLLLSLPLILICLAQALADNNTTIASTGHYWGNREIQAPAVVPPITPPSIQSNGPEHRQSVLQGGDTFADAFVIPSLPFNDDGTTTGLNNDYQAPCGAVEGVPDVVYSYTPSVNQIINIHLCGTTFYSVVYVYENNIDTPIACSNFGLTCGYDRPRGAIDLLSINAGSTYYIVVDGYAPGFEGPYSIQVYEQPHVVCPPTAIAEGEVCQDGYIDNFNSGCSDVYNAFSPIAINDTICGMTGTWAVEGGRMRDCDWYTITLTETQVLNWGAVADCPIQLMIFYAKPCPQLIDMAFGQGNAGDTVRVSANCVPGTYYVFISPQTFDPLYGCPETYLAWLNSSPSPAAPANDNCSNVTPQQLIPGSPLTFTGDNTGATMDCPTFGVPEVWIAFQMDVTANVTLDYCGTTPPWGVSFTKLATSCPCDGIIGENMYSNSLCGYPNNNFTVRWDNLPPGTYYYPIMSKEGTNSGQYNIQVQAQGDPLIDVNPLQITGSEDPGNSTSQPLTIANAGYAPLNYNIDVTELSDRILNHPTQSNSPAYFGADRPTLGTFHDVAMGIDRNVGQRVLQGGDNIASATVISALPYYDDGTTVGATDDYSSNCGGTGAPDVVYSFTPPNNMWINVALCGSAFNTSLEVMQNDPNTVIGCNDDGCDQASKLDQLHIFAGNTYYIVVDGAAETDNGDYTIQVTEYLPCTVTCPEGAIAELEACGDSTNNGCFASTPPYIAEPMALNSSLCGTVWSNDQRRDVDIYAIDITDPSILTVTGNAEFPIQMAIIDAGQGCPVTQIMRYGVADPCTPLSLQANLIPGTYWIYVSPAGWYNMPCDGNGDFLNHYVLSTHTEHAWLYADSHGGSIPIFGAPAAVNVTLDASLLTPGVYHGNINILSNSVQDPELNVPVTLTVNGSSCQYVVGDANNSGTWTGQDVTYGVRFFKGGNPPPYSCECTPGHTWYVAGDVNGSCSFTGQDVTRMVLHFKSGVLGIPCPDCAPAGNILIKDKVNSALDPSKGQAKISAQ